MTFQIPKTGKIETTEQIMTKKGALSILFNVEDGRFITLGTQNKAPSALEHKLYPAPRKVEAVVDVKSKRLNVTSFSPEKETEWEAILHSEGSVTTVTAPVLYKSLSAPVSAFMLKSISEGGLIPGFTIWDSTTDNGRKIGMDLSRETLTRILAVSKDFGCLTYHFDSITKAPEYIAYWGFQIKDDELVMTENINFITGVDKVPLRNVLSEIQERIWTKPVFMNNPMQFYIFSQKEAVPALMGFTTHYPVGLWGCNCIYDDYTMGMKRGLKPVEHNHLLVNRLSAVASGSSLFGIPIVSMMEDVKKFGDGAKAFLLHTLVEKMCFAWSLDDLNARPNLVEYFSKKLGMKTQKEEYVSIRSTNSLHTAPEWNCTRFEPWYSGNRLHGKEFMRMWSIQELGDSTPMETDFEGNDDETRYGDTYHYTIHSDDGGNIKVNMTNIQPVTKISELKEILEKDQEKRDKKKKRKQPEIPYEKGFEMEETKEKKVYLNKPIRKVIQAGEVSKEAKRMRDNYPAIEKMDRNELQNVIEMMMRKIARLEECAFDDLDIVVNNGVVKLVKMD